MYVLGISCYYHDSAAAVIKDGQTIAAVEEERFSRIKFDDGFPKQAIDWCLREAGISPKDIDAVAFYDKPILKFERLLDNYIPDEQYQILIRAIGPFYSIAGEHPSPQHQEILHSRLSSAVQEFQKTDDGRAKAILEQSLLAVEQTVQRCAQIRQQADRYWGKA